MTMQSFSFFSFFHTNSSRLFSLIYILPFSLKVSSLLVFHRCKVIFWHFLLMDMPSDYDLSTQWHIIKSHKQEGNTTTYEYERSKTCRRVFLAPWVKKMGNLSMYFCLNIHKKNSGNIHRKMTLFALEKGTERGGRRREIWT